jgi:hypothetical protein
LGTRRIPQPLAATALGVLRTAELIEAATLIAVLLAIFAVVMAGG